MAKKKPTLSRTKADDDAVYDEADDEQDEQEWVDVPADQPAQPAAATTATTDPAALVGTNQELNPDEPVYGPPEDTIDLPETDWSPPPLRPEDQVPEPYGYDISPNQFFNVKAQSMPEDRPDHDKPIKDKGKDVNEYERGETVQAVEMEVRDDLPDDVKERKQEQDRAREQNRDLDRERDRQRKERLGLAPGRDRDRDQQRSKKGR